MEELIVENIIFSANLAEKFDISYLSKQFINSKYNVNEFSGLILNLDNPKSAVFLFPNGKMLCTGIKKIDDIEIVINKIINDIETHKILVFDDIHIIIENIIASKKLTQNLNLDFIKNEIKFENIIDNQDNFLNVIINMTNIEINAIIFESGKIVFTGAKELNDIKNALNLIEEEFVNIGVI